MPAVQLPPNSTGQTIEVVSGADGISARQVSIRPQEWSQAHTPTTATQATTSKAAGASGVKHVCTSIQFGLAVDGTNAQTVIHVNLRDGATGAGTILWSTTLLMAATEAMKLFGLSGLNIPGSAATAMTLEFSAAGVTGSLQSVAMTGYEQNP